MGLKKFLGILRSMSALIWITTIIFGLSMAAGWFSTGAIQSLLVNQLDQLGEVAQGLQQSDNAQLSFFIFIFLNNAIKCVLVIFLGAAFGIFPLLFITINGMVIGFLVHMVASSGTVSLYDLIVKGLLPHGIIELPVLVIACAYGLRFGGMVWSSITGAISGERSTRRDWPSFMRETGNMSLWVVVLLFIAAVIESTVTYSLLGG